MTATCWQVVPPPLPRREEAWLPEDLEESSEKAWALHPMKSAFLKALTPGFWDGRRPGGCWGPLYVPQAPRPGYIRRQAGSSR